MDYEDLEWTVASDNTERLVADDAREALETATAVELIEDEPADTAAVDTTVVEQPADEATDVAAAPAAPAATENVDEVETGAVQPMDSAVGEAPSFDPGALTEFDESTLTADDLLGTNVYGPNNEHIGTIGDFVLSADGNVDAIIIDFGGFLGIGVKQVAIGYDDLRFYTDDMGNRSLLLNVTREQMEQATAFNRETYQAERDTQRMVVSAL